MKKTFATLGMGVLLGLVVSLAGCGDGVKTPAGPTPSAGAGCPTTVNGNGNAVICGTGNAITQNPAPTATPTPSVTPVPEAGRIDYLVMNGPEVIAVLGTADYELTPMHVNPDGKAVAVDDGFNIPRAPYIRWTITGGNATVTGAQACSALPGEQPGAVVVCGFKATVKRTAAGQFGISAVIEQRGATRYIN